MATTPAFKHAIRSLSTTAVTPPNKEIAELEAIWGRPVVVRALERATRFRRFKAADVRAILMAGSGLPSPVRAGVQLQFELPEVPTRPLSAYAMAGLQ